MAAAVLLLIVVAFTAPAALAVGSRMAGAASDGAAESTAAGWLALGIAITALIVTIGFVMITAARGEHRPAPRGGLPHAT